MKKFLIAILGLAMVSCSSNSNQVPVTGNPYEVIIIANANVFHSAVGDTLKNILSDEVEGISRIEPIFDVYNVAPNAMKTLAAKHRNLLFVKVDPKFVENEFYADTNMYAKDQLGIYFQGPNIDTLAKYIYQNKSYLTGLLNIYEQNRFVKRVNAYNEKGLETLISKKFGFNMRIPKGYRIKNDDDNFLWLSFETALGSQGIIIYTFDQAPNGENWLVEQRDIAVGKIPGPSEGSYMATEKRFPAKTTLTDIKGRQWYQTRGLWMVENDFMGGPYISFVTEFNGRYLAIDCFVQEPDVKKTHRNFIRQFESLPLTVTFPKEK